jgi:hypothetical protein
MVGSEKLTKQRDRGHDILTSLRVGQQLTPDHVDWLSTKTTEFREAVFIEETITHTKVHTKDKIYVNKVSPVRCTQKTS